MSRPFETDGRRNLIGERLPLLRRERGWSQRDLAKELQLLGFDMDKNVITRIETNQRYVSDIEIRALARVFDISYEALMGSVW